MEQKKLIISTVIDIEETLKIAGDMDMLREIFGMLKQMLPDERVKLEALYAQNDIVETRKILHRLDGTFRSCIVPQLQLARGELHDAVRNVNQLDVIRDKYTAFYQEIDNFCAEYEKLKREGEL